MKAKTLAALLLTTLLSSLGFAQVSPENNPIVAAANVVGHKGLPATTAPAKSPTVFKPAAAQVFAPHYIEKTFESATEREAVKPVFDNLFQSFSKTTAGAGFANDSSAAFAFAVSFLHSIASGSELDEEAYPVLIGQFQAYFNQPAIQKATDKQKQEAYEYALCSVATVAVYATSAKTEDDLK